MKQLMTLFAAAGALAGTQMVATTPAEAGGWCRYTSTYYKTVQYWPVVKRVVPYRVIGYRLGKVRSCRRGWCQ